MVQCPKKRIRAFPICHVPHQFQVSRGLRVNHHGAFDGDVADAERVCGVTGVETRFRVLKEGASCGKSIISVLLVSGT